MVNCVYLVIKGYFYSNYKKMRTTITFLFICLFTAMSYAQLSKPETVKAFTAEAVDYSGAELNEHSPISSFNKIAYEQADKAIVITKDNMAASIQEAASYKTCIITVGTHTIAKVTNMSKKIMSGSWGCRIPLGEGYIQNNGLTHKEDYLNNIIGTPNSQRRMMFLFK